MKDAAARELTAARARREQLADTLLKIVGQGSALAGRITAARRPDDALEVDESLKDLVAVGRQLLASKDAAVQTRRTHWKLDAAWLDACESLATRARGHRAVVQKPGALAPTQKQLDAWDGVVLRLLADVVGAFNRANAVNPEVPRVAYVSLRARAARRERPECSPAKPADP